MADQPPRWVLEAAAEIVGRFFQEQDKERKKDALNELTRLAHARKGVKYVPKD